MNIKTIDTRPVRDPYTNIDGCVSRTVLWLDPRDRTCGVSQEYPGNHSTTMDRWNGLELTWHVAGHPQEEFMHSYILDNSDKFDAICDGFEVVWNGNNHVGHLSDAASEARWQIELDLEDEYAIPNYYDWYTVDSWLESSIDEITADTTDQELESYAQDWEPSKSDVVMGRWSILEYITARRDDLRLERELYGE